MANISNLRATQTSLANVTKSAQNAEEFRASNSRFMWGNTRKLMCDRFLDVNFLFPLPPRPGPQPRHPQLAVPFSPYRRRHQPPWNFLLPPYLPSSSRSPRPSFQF